MQFHQSADFAADNDPGDALNKGRGSEVRERRRFLPYFAAAQDEGDAVHPLCHTRVVTSGAKTENVAVIFHGLGTCPQQFAEVADALHAEGWNVLLVHLPYHGMADRLSEAPAAMQANEVLREAGRWIDVAQGLGDHVTVVGFSGGGTVAAYLANVRHREDRLAARGPVASVLSMFDNHSFLTLSSVQVMMQPPIPQVRDNGIKGSRNENSYPGMGDEKG